jgi:hypothetical protein
MEILRTTPLLIISRVLVNNFHTSILFYGAAMASLPMAIRPGRPLDRVKCPWRRRATGPWLFIGALADRPLG